MKIYNIHNKEGIEYYAHDSKRKNDEVQIDFEIDFDALDWYHFWLPSFCFCLEVNDVEVNDVSKST